MVKEVTLKDMADVKRLNDVACSEGVKITVSKGSICVDARSLLGLYTLIGSKVMLAAPDHSNPERFVKVLDRVAL